MANPYGIDFDLTIPLGDFGLGSDAPIVLDYRRNPAQPRVLRLRYPKKASAKIRWAVTAPDFPTFVEMLGL